MGLDPSAKIDGSDELRKSLFAFILAYLVSLARPRHLSLPDICGDHGMNKHTKS